MNITASQVNELRQMTGAGMMDCKKALVETDGDIQAAIDILRKKGMAKAAKRADRTASEGCVLSKATEDHKYAAIIMVNCETDFVANNADFVKFTKDVLDMAVANRVKDIEALKAMMLDGQTVEALVANQSAVTGEKTELGAFKVLEGAYVANYNHPGNRLATIVEMNKSFDGVEEVSHEVCMHVAAMNPLSVSEASIPQEVKDRELSVAIDKTKEEQIQKEVEKALRKAGINPNQPSEQVLQGELPAQPSQPRRRPENRRRIHPGRRQGSHCGELRAYQVGRVIPDLYVHTACV